ncbi:MAG: carboxypeptidase regulatory-like domain-containing protein [Armatimonadetes bacterium]|nr:carboxypeptidase regulatory-like domain-containing protein [Armatimonadota bacterium]
MNRIIWLILIIFGIAWTAGCGGGGGGGGDGTTTATVTGRVVVFGTTTPISGATILSEGKTATADNAGNFTLPGLTTGSGTVTARENGYEDAVLAVTLVAGANALGDIGLSTSNPPPAPYTISGKVTIQGSADASGVVVEAVKGGTSEKMTTGSNGAFFLLVPPGTYTLTAAKTGYTASLPSIQVTVTDPNHPVKDRNFTLVKN